MSNNPSTRTRRRVLAVVLAIALIGVLCAVLWNQPSFRPLPKRFTAVDPGVLYRSSQPSTRQIQKLVDDFGIRTVLIVRAGSSKRVPDETEFARSIGVRVVHIPINSRQAIPDEQVSEFFECVDDVDNRPVLVHCSAGRHRTGYLCAMYRIERQGWSVERAVEEMLSFGFATDSQKAILNQLEGYRPARGGTDVEQVIGPGSSGGSGTP